MAIKIKFAIIAALFDYNPKLSDAMKPDSWEKCMAGVDALLDMIEEFENVVTTGELIMEENEVLDSQPYKIRGCYLTAVERLDEEFIKVSCCVGGVARSGALSGATVTLVRSCFIDYYVRYIIYCTGSIT